MRGLRKPIRCLLAGSWIPPAIVRGERLTWMRIATKSTLFPQEITIIQYTSPMPKAEAESI